MVDTHTQMQAEYNIISCMDSEDSKDGICVRYIAYRLKQTFHDNVTSMKHMSCYKYLTEQLMDTVFNTDLCNNTHIISDLICYNIFTASDISRIVKLLHEKKINYIPDLLSEDALEHTIIRSINDCVILIRACNNMFQYNSTIIEFTPWDSLLKNKYLTYEMIEYINKFGLLSLSVLIKFPLFYSNYESRLENYERIIFNYCNDLKNNYDDINDAIAHVLSHDKDQMIASLEGSVTYYWYLLSQVRDIISNRPDITLEHIQKHTFYERHVLYYKSKRSCTMYVKNIHKNRLWNYNILVRKFTFDEIIAYPSLFNEWDWHYILEKNRPTLKFMLSLNLTRFVYKYTNLIALCLYCKMTTKDVCIYAKKIRDGVFKSHKIYYNYLTANESFTFADIINSPYIPWVQSALRFNPNIYPNYNDIPVENTCFDNNAFIPCKLIPIYKELSLFPELKRELHQWHYNKICNKIMHPKRMYARLIAHAYNAGISYDEIDLSVIIDDVHEECRQLIQAKMIELSN